MISASKPCRRTSVPRRCTSSRYVTAGVAASYSRRSRSRHWVGPVTRLWSDVGTWSRAHSRGMTTTRNTRTFTPARIVALALIAVLIGGLTSLRFGSAPEHIEVPAHAKAGDLLLHKCDYATEKGDYSADCGTLVVPENRDKPNSRLIAVPVTRIHSRSPGATEPIFRLEGEPR